MNLVADPKIVAESRMIAEAVAIADELRQYCPESGSASYLLHTVDCFAHGMMSLEELREAVADARRNVEIVWARFF